MNKKFKNIIRYIEAGLKFVYLLILIIVFSLMILYYNFIKHFFDSLLNEVIK